MAEEERIAVTEELKEVEKQLQAVNNLDKEVRERLLAEKAALRMKETALITKETALITEKTALNAALIAKETALIAKETAEKNLLIEANRRGAAAAGGGVGTGDLDVRSQDQTLLQECNENMRMVTAKFMAPYKAGLKAASDKKH